jgi:hypothetical protein
MMSWICFCTSLVKRLVVDVSLHSWTTFGLLTMLIKTDSENVKIKLQVKWQKAYFIVMMIGTCPLWYTSVTEISFQVMYSLVLNYDSGKWNENMGKWFLLKKNDPWMMQIYQNILSGIPNICFAFCSSPVTFLKAKWAFAITWCRSSVNFSHFNLLLWNRLVKWTETW